MEAGDCGGSARHQDEFAPAMDELLGQAQGEVAHDRNRLVAVGNVGGVREIQEGLAGELALRFPQNGEAAQS